MRILIIIVLLALPAYAHANALEQLRTFLPYTTIKERFQKLADFEALVQKMNQEEKNTLLLLAAEKGLDFIIVSLIEKKAHINCCDENGDTPLHWAVRSDKLMAVRALLSDSSIDSSIKNKHGNTPLDIAKKFNRIPLMRLLLSQEKRTLIHFSQKSDVMICVTPP